jgi:hypothetical protein
LKYKKVGRNYYYIEGDKMNMKERYDLFVEKLKEEGYEFAGEDMSEEVYKYVGDAKLLQNSYVRILKIRSPTTLWGFRSVKTELILDGFKHTKAIPVSMEELVEEIERLKK